MRCTMRDTQAGQSIHRRCMPACFMFDQQTFHDASLVESFQGVHNACGYCHSLIMVTASKFVTVGCPRAFNSTMVVGCKCCCTVTTAVNSSSRGHDGVLQGRPD